MSSLRASRALLILLALAALAALPLAAGQPFDLTVAVLDLGPLGPAGIGVVGALVPVLLLVLVTGIGAIVASYAARNLVGQQRLRRFALGEVVAVVGLATAVVAPSVLQLAVGWTVGGLAVAALVGHTGTRPARRAMLVVASRLLVGDVALWVLVVVAGLGLGTLDLASLESAVATSSTLVVTVAALLVVVAGIARSALVPLHRWLPETAEAPSPVSALLHAGLVNGVGVLALLLWPLLAASLPARGVLLALAVATALLGTAQVRVRPDVKGRLAASTTAQMGYLGVQAALGLPAAVIAHLVGHGLWKASQFLGAGGAVERARRAVPHAVATGPRRTLLSWFGAVAVVAAAVSVPGPWGPPLVQGPASLLPAIVAAAALAAALLGGARLRTRAHLVAVLASMVAVVAYLLGLRLLTAATESSIPAATPEWGQPGAVAVTVLVALLVLIGAGFWWFDSLARAGRGRRVVDAVARTSMPAATPRELLRGVTRVDASLLAAARQAPTDDDVQQARAALRATSDLVGPVWPLESFVASNPLASLEFLDFHDALQVAARTWGSRSGPSGALLSRAREAGRVDDAAIAAAAAHLLDRRDPMVAGVARIDVVTETLLHDEALDVAPRAASAYVSLVHARVYAATAWRPSDGGVWAAVRADAGLDRALGVRGARELAHALPAEPDRAVTVLLRLLGASSADRMRVVGGRLTASAGWAAHVAWRLRQGVAVPGVQGDDAEKRRIDATADLLVVGLLAEVLDPHYPASSSPLDSFEVATAVSASLGLDTVPSPIVDVVAEVQAVGVERLRLQAWEHATHEPLVAQIGSRAADLGGVGVLAPSARAAGGPDAALVTCIDVRSERLRRRLEEAGPWETFGAAGFFGLPLRHVAPDGAVSERCPVLIRPERTVVERGTETSWTWSTTEAADALHGVEARPFTPYALAEASGWLLGPLSALRTAAPGWWSHVSRRMRSAVGSPGAGPLEVSGSAGVGFAPAELVDLAAAFLLSTGLVDLPPLVVLCGHGGAATNNPHLAAYDCGACGGRAGDVSARAMVQTLQDAAVRAGLLERGIDVSQTTFVAALHDTTRDRVTLLDVEPAPGTTLARLVDDLALACDAVAEERRPSLPQAPGPVGAARLRRHLERRAGDWAQVRPEWGLAGCSAMVIGPRSLTAGHGLGGRVFLQSYRADLDPDGALLESLMAGPLVVGQWISQQYWCSTVDPDHFGAGDKTTHNVVVPGDGVEHSLSGVLTGARGDLRIGLPWQAVSASAPVDGSWVDLPHHDPVRLLAVVCASTAVVDAVLARQPQVARLVLGGWISLRVVDPSSGDVRRLDPARGWVADLEAPARERQPGQALPSASYAR